MLPFNKDCFLGLYPDPQAIVRSLENEWSLQKCQAKNCRHRGVNASFGELNCGYFGVISFMIHKFT
jgi:hypothetical protein